MVEKVIRLAAIFVLAVALGFIIAVGTYPKIFTVTEYKYLNITNEVKVVEYVPVEKIVVKEVNVTVNNTIIETVVPNFLQAADDIVANNSYYQSYYPVSYRNRMNDDYLSLIRARLGYDGKRRDGWLGNDLSNCVTWSEVWVPVDAATGKIIEPSGYGSYHEGSCKT